MHTSPRNLPKGVRFNAPLLDSAVRRCAQPALRGPRAIHTLLQPSLSELEPMMTKLLSATAVALTLFAATSANAETKGLTMVTTTLAYDTRDIANPAGAAKMLSRIELAAQNLCAPSSPTAKPTGRLVVVCRHAAVARAVDTLAAPLVTAAYQGRQVEVASR